MIKVVIIEDDPGVIRELTQALSEDPGLSILGSAGSVASAESLICMVKPELVFIDVNLSDGNAFDLLCRLSPIDFKIVFLTAYSEYAIRAIKYGALDYLLKPLDSLDLHASISLFREKSMPVKSSQQLDVVMGHAIEKPASQESRIILSTVDYLQVLQLKDIIYCESQGAYTNFFINDGRKIIISKPLKYYEELLPEGLFLRSHQSYLINLIYIDKYVKSGMLVLRNGSEIPVSIRRKEYVLKSLSKIS